MTKSEQLANLIARLTALGFSLPEIQRLRRIQSTLHRWSEAECNGEIQRDEDNGNKPRRMYDSGFMQYIPDREAGALKRLCFIMADHPDLWAYHQTDPRGCALYVGKRADLKTTENQIVAKANSWGGNVRPHAGGFNAGFINKRFDTEEAAAIAYLKQRSASIPARDMLPIDQYYTRGVAVCV